MKIKRRISRRAERRQNDEDEETVDMRKEMKKIFKSTVYHSSVEIFNLIVSKVSINFVRRITFSCLIYMRKNGGRFS